MSMGITHSTLYSTTEKLFDILLKRLAAARDELYMSSLPNPATDTSPITSCIDFQKES